MFDGCSSPVLNGGECAITLKICPCTNQSLQSPHIACWKRSKNTRMGPHCAEKTTALYQWVWLKEKQQVPNYDSLTWFPPWNFGHSQFPTVELVEVPNGLFQSWGTPQNFDMTGKITMNDMCLKNECIEICIYINYIYIYNAWLAFPTENPNGRNASSPPVQEAAAARPVDNTNSCPQPTPVRLAARHQTHPPHFPKGLPEPMGLQCMTCWFEDGDEPLRKGNRMLVIEDEMSGIHIPKTSKFLTC